MKYTFYLFSKLFDAYFKKEYEYDLMYEDLCQFFIWYQLSHHSEQSKGEYECILDFFKAEEKIISKSINKHHDPVY